MQVKKIKFETSLYNFSLSLLLKEHYKVDMENKTV